jgi:hypothetical protein
MNNTRSQQIHKILSYNEEDENDTQYNTNKNWQESKAQRE